MLAAPRTKLIPESTPLRGRADASLLTRTSTFTRILTNVPSDLAWHYCRCFGDFCKYGLQQPPSSRASHGWNEDGRDHVGYKALSKPSKLVSYRSILKCRAEEKAIALKVGPGVSSGYPGPGHLGLPIPTASDCVEDKDPETAFREVSALGV